jgi:integrase/recombinase XerD
MTVFLSNRGSLEAAQDMANHADPRTTKLYDRRKDLAKLSEIEPRIAFS